MHRLLQRQLNKFLSPELENNPAIKEFVKSINNAYNNYETDFKQLERILEISSKESFKELNNIRFALDLVAAVFIIDFKGIIHSANDQFCSIIKYEKSEVINRNYLDILDINGNTNIDAIKIKIKNGEVWRGDLEILDKNKKQVYTNTSIIPFTNNENEMNKFLFISFDITAQKESENEFKKISMVANKTQNSVVITNSLGEIEWTNLAFEKTTGYTHEEVKGKIPGHLLQGKATDNETVLFIRKKLKEKVPFECEILNYNKQKIPFWTKLQIQPLFDEEGNLNQFFALQQDITQEKLTKETLKLNEEKYRSIIANMNLGLIETDVNDKIISINQSFSTMTGYTFDELKGKIAKEILLSKESIELVKDKEILRQNDISDAYEVEAIKKNGEHKTWLISGAPLYDSLGIYIGSIGIHLDITKQKETERNLKLFKKLVDYSGDAIKIVNENGDFFYVNENSLQELGYSLDEILKLNVKKIDTFFKKTGAWEKHINELKQKENGILLEGELKNKSGHTFPVEIQANYVKLDNKGFVVASSRNIEERKFQELKRLELLEKLKNVNQELSEFAYVISHDLKAPLRAIGSLSSWLKTDYSEKFDEEGKNILSLLEQRTHRMHNLIEGVLNYSRVGQTKEAIIPQNSFFVVKNLIDLLSPPTNIKINIDKNLPIVKFEDVKFGQVFQNLLSNAIKFMDKENGKIEIGFNKANDEFHFFVKDNGPGIEMHHQQKIFQIFQTLNSRDDFESTGVGLSIVKKIVEGNGGKIWLESIIGEGTTFFFSVKK